MRVTSLACAALRTEPTTDPAAAQSDTTFALDRASALIAHEIRGPVIALVSVSKGLHELLFDDDELGQTVSDLQEQCIRLKALVENLVDYSRPLNAWREEVPVDVVVRSVFASTRRAHPGGSRLLLELEHPSPIAVVDPVLLARALSNLVTNALEHGALGGRIEISVTTTHGEVRIRVRNGGPPIDRASAEHLFEPFHVTASGRVGLGLAVARRMAQAAGGRLELDRWGSGVSFSIWLEPAAVPPPSS